MNFIWTRMAFKFPATLFLGPEAIAASTGSTLVERDYLPEVERLVRTQIPNVTSVHIFDQRIRRNVSYQSAGLRHIDLNNRAFYLLPVNTAHVEQVVTHEIFQDSTPASAVQRVRREMGDQAESLLKGRIRITNLWRPINHRVEDNPLAVCDGSLVDYDDMLASDHVTRDYVGETFNLMYRSKYDWYYISNQDVDEVLMFKTYDSSSQVAARHCPHASFHHAKVPAGTLPRESIEVRVLIFSND
ncbi:hypothetical protein B0T17DRAFT_505418 [Bombardia bombarda]|uniref:Methyltransferase n=1 Tax=Bombardia bombarda TaxID=252184 RepID=A0AA39X7M2_9PEZI|nr:hypothetical protein B0T17DRAFT_505418 [Bombardia bombarda]